jgi:SAM-dependent methyltransferase
MKSSHLLKLSIIVFLSVITLSLACQVKNNNEYHPEVGQEGKDVVWVPTPQALVEKMLELARITPEDILIDLGSGDGRTVITAAKRGIKALGIEYNPEMVKLSRHNAEIEGVSDKAQFTEADLFEFDFSKATVITMFLLPDINIRLRPTILDLKPGTRIVSNTFTMEDWSYDDSVTIEDSTTRWNTAFLWIVPSKVNGTWKLADGELNLTQNFQMISGSIKTPNASSEISDGRLRGNEIHFSAGGYVYKGIVDGSKMEGTVSNNGKTDKWNASR